MKLCGCECGRQISENRQFAHGHYLGNGRIPFKVYEPTLCECGCGRLAPLAQRTRRGYRKGEPMRFIQGHFSRTEAASPPPHHSGENNNRWLGEQASIAAFHKAVCARFPKRGVCQLCGFIGRTDYALIKGHEYSRNRIDYLELCRLCHNRYDGVVGRMPRGPDGRFVAKQKGGGAVEDSLAK